MIRSLRVPTLVATALTLTTIACSDDKEPECKVGQECPCTTRFDCPDPLVEQCSAPFGFDGVCVPVVDQDTGYDADVSTEDAGQDAGDDAGDATDDTTVLPDAGEDAEQDAGDVTEETSPDAGDADIDDADADATDPDATDADVTDADADDTDTGDTPPIDRTLFDGWVAYQSIATFDQVHLISGDGLQGPYSLPTDTDPSATRTPAFSPDGAKLAYIYVTIDGPTLRVTSLADAATSDFLVGEFTALRSPDWHPDGERIAFSGQRDDERDVWNNFVFDLESGTATALTELTAAQLRTHFVSPASWSADGTQLYYVAGTPPDIAAGVSGSSDIWRIDGDGSSATQITTGIDPTSLRVSVRPDGAELMFDTTRPVRLGLSEEPPHDGIPKGAIVDVGIAGTDANCVYIGNSNAIACERLQTPALTNCALGEPDCDPDICVINLQTGALIRNLTRTVGTREGAIAVSGQPFSELPLDGFADAP